MEKDRRNFTFDRTNFILLGVSMAIVIIGFILMAGGTSTETQFNPEVYNAQRIKVAPVVCLIGFLAMIYAILRKPAHKTPENEQ